jgi:hypothetical protein
MIKKAKLLSLFKILVFWVQEIPIEKNLFQKEICVILQQFILVTIQKSLNNLFFLQF